MTHPHTAEMINRQIDLEFEKLNAFMTFESDKPEILNRIERLKSMLDENEVQEPPVPPNPKKETFVGDFIAAFCKR